MEQAADQEAEAERRYFERHGEQFAESNHERDIQTQADELLRDPEWIWDTVAYHKDLAELIGSMGLAPFSIDRSQALHSKLREIAIEDAEGMVEPFMLRRQID